MVLQGSGVVHLGTSSTPRSTRLTKLPVGALGLDFIGEDKSLVDLVEEPSEKSERAPMTKKWTASPSKHTLNTRAANGERSQGPQARALDASLVHDQFFAAAARSRVENQALAGHGK